MLSHHHRNDADSGCLASLADSQNELIRIDPVACASPHHCDSRAFLRNSTMP